jgi:D-arabinose 5-phosphate isomerase GutQ
MRPLVSMQLVFIVWLTSSLATAMPEKNLIILLLMGLGRSPISLRRIVAKLACLHCVFTVGDTELVHVKTHFLFSFHIV